MKPKYIRPKIHRKTIIGMCNKVVSIGVRLAIKIINDHKNADKRNSTSYLSPSQVVNAMNKNNIHEHNLPTLIQYVYLYNQAVIHPHKCPKDNATRNKPSLTNGPAYNSELFNVTFNYNWPKHLRKWANSVVVTTTKNFKISLVSATLGLSKCSESCRSAKTSTD